jgi:hypothetical protein
VKQIWKEDWTMSDVLGPALEEGLLLSLLLLVHHLQEDQAVASAGKVRSVHTKLR